MERHENMMLGEDNSRFSNEKFEMRTKLSRPICSVPGVLNGTGASNEEDQLLLENAPLKDELICIWTLLNKFLGETISPFASSPITQAPRV
ncbi:hypothetical protein SAY87_030188 [Trapa incisa]|uniref:Uncharacterized protein n=1 Tax=Trapa incisa TaxID=236973 RepID=A0AAN7QAI7_9MYRT|nr:hypothetical protein SAY87_030188 [Trapa incisa]